MGAAARTGKREIWVCLFSSPRGYTTERTRRYFKMPPSSGFPFIHKISTVVAVVGGRLGGECRPPSPPHRAVCATFPLIHHLHTGRRMYLAHPNVQQAEDVWRYSGCNGGLFLLLANACVPDAHACVIHLYSDSIALNKYIKIRKK